MNYQTIAIPGTPAATLLLMHNYKADTRLTRADLCPTTPTAALIAIAHTGEYVPERGTGRTTRIALAMLLEASDNPGMYVAATDHCPTGHGALYHRLKELSSAISGATVENWKCPRNLGHAIQNSNLIRVRVPVKL